jgi:Holliday junction resolvase-like predicted endonuclease
MSPSEKRRPGEHIRKLIKQRQQSALVHYIFAAGVLISAFFLFSIFSHSSLGIVFLLGGLAISCSLCRKGQYLGKRVSDAERGAQAEVQVSSLLLPLQRQGWQIEYNLPIRKWGDADVVLCSSKSNWFVVDVKSHGGTKVYENGSLQMRYGKNTHSFREGDLISKVKGQISEVKSLKNTRWITGLLCFTRGDVNIPGKIIDGIYIVTANDLVNTLLQLDH